MRGKAIITNPLDMEIEITLSAKLSTWQRFREQINPGAVIYYPASEVVEIIRDLERKASAVLLSDPSPEVTGS